MELVTDLVRKEEERQKSYLTLIASENHCSQAVRDVLGSRLTDKYAEGYPGKRYYHGCEVVDEIESLCIESACKLFKCGFANVQPHSGSQANEAAFLALLEPGDTILSLDLSHGGHLTHGYKINSSGRFYKVHHYKANDEGIIDMESVREIALTVKPKLIIAGASTYSRILDWNAFRKIADEVGAYLLADVAHFLGLIAGGKYPTPVGIADVITSSTHKVMRGPRGGVILWDNPAYTAKLNRSVFPGTQGGPLMHSIAGKAICFMEGATEGYRQYCDQVVSNAKTFAEGLKQHGMDIVSGGTDCHMFVVDFRHSMPDLVGMDAANILSKNHLIVNKQLVPNDHRDATKTSGIRIGVAAATSRGMGTNEMCLLADIVASILKSGSDRAAEVKQLCEKFSLG